MTDLNAKDHLPLDPALEAQALADYAAAGIKPHAAGAIYFKDDAAAIGYKGYVDLGYEVHSDDPMPGVISSYAYMRGMLTGMGIFAAREGRKAAVISMWPLVKILRYCRLAAGQK